MKINPIMGQPPGSGNDDVYIYLAPAPEAVYIMLSDSSGIETETVVGKLCTAGLRLRDVNSYHFYVGSKRLDAKVF